MLAAEASRVHPQRASSSTAGPAHTVTHHPGRGSQTPVTRSSADHLEILNWSKTKELKENLRLSLSGRLNVLPLKGICVKEAVNEWGMVPGEQELPHSF